MTVVDISTAFLNAKLSSSRTVYTKPPGICVHFGLAKPDEIWSLTKALYGLKEAPALWEEERDKKLRTLVITHPKHGKLHLQQSVTHHSVWLVIVGTTGSAYAQDLDLQGWFPDLTGLTAQKIVGAVLIYVDDFLFLLDTLVRTEVVGAIASIWKTSEPRTLGLNGVRELSFLGMDVQIPEEVRCVEDPEVVILHQSRYALDVLQRFVEAPMRPRNNPGEAVSFSSKGKHPLEVFPPTDDPQKIY